jgi:hypothetical protein
MRTPFAALALAGLISLPVFALNAPQDRQDERQKQDKKDERGANREGERKAAEYHFRQEDAPKLRQHYKNIEKVDTAHRSELVPADVYPMIGENGCIRYRLP